LTPGVDKGEEQIKAEHRPGANVIKNIFSSLMKGPNYCCLSVGLWQDFSDCLRL
jgi:hypothetical protein